MGGGIMEMSRTSVAVASRRLGRALVRRLRFALIIACLLSAALPAQYWPQPLAAAGAAAASVPFDDGMGPYALINHEQLNGRRSGGLFAATEQQRESIRALEQQAIDIVIQDHQLAPGETAAVRSWGRTDAQAVLFLLIIKAINTPLMTRTPVQQDVVDWFTAVQMRQNKLAANAAGMEYVKWAGLNETAFWNLTQTNVGAGVLTDFLDDDIRDAEGVGPCHYASPSPFETEYTGRSNASCFIPTPNPMLPPSYESFVKWGTAQATYASTNSAEFAQAAASIGLAIGTSVGAATGLGLAIGTAAAIAGGTGATLASSIWPYAVQYAPAVVAANIAAVVVIVVIAIVVAVIAGIAIFSAAAIPGQLANLIAASWDTPDLVAIAASAGGLQGLFTLFVRATEPTPRSESCDNRLVSPYDSFVNRHVKPCLNAPPIPGDSPYDPTFVIRPLGSDTPTNSRTLTVKAPFPGTATTVRMSGFWFVTQHNGMDTSQALRFTYIDTAGQARTAWLFGNATTGYKFLTMLSGAGTVPTDFATCQAAGSCAYESEIQFTGADGNHYRAQVVPVPRPSMAPTFVPSAPNAGHPVTFTANGTSPNGLALTYSWQFQETSRPETCITDPNGIITCTEGPEQLGVCHYLVLQPGGANFPTPGPCFTDPVQGSIVTHTFTLNETYLVKLTATDSSGVATQTVFSVTVVKVPVNLNFTAPAPITYGTPLSATQLSALADTPGTYAYSVSGQTANLGDVLPAGTHSLQVQFTPEDSTTYQIPAPVSVPLQVNKAPLTVTVENTSITFGGPLPAFTARFSGFVNGDTAAVVSGSPIFSTTASPGSPVGTYPVTVAQGSLSAANYTFGPFIPGTLSITKLGTALSAVSGSATYGDSTGTLTATLQRIGGGTAPLAGATITFSVDGVAVCGASGRPSCPKTNAQGVATISGVPIPGGLDAGNHAGRIRATFAEDATYLGASASGPLKIARKTLWIKPADRSVGRNQPNPPSSPPAGCIAQQTPTAACWLELVPGHAFVDGDEWTSLNLANLRFAYGRSLNGPANEKTGAQYRITVLGALSSNYDLRYQTGTLTVGP